VQTVDKDLFDYYLGLSLPIGGESTRIEIGPGQLVLPTEGDPADEEGENHEDEQHDATTPAADPDDPDPDPRAAAHEGRGRAHIKFSYKKTWFMTPAAMDQLIAMVGDSRRCVDPM